MTASPYEEKATCIHYHCHPSGIHMYSLSLPSIRYSHVFTIIAIHQVFTCIATYQGGHLWTNYAMNNNIHYSLHTGAYSSSLQHHSQEGRCCPETLFQAATSHPGSHGHHCPSHPESHGHHCPSHPGSNGYHCPSHPGSHGHHCPSHPGSHRQYCWFCVKIICCPLPPAQDH